MFAVQAYYWLPSHSLSVAYRWRCSYWGGKKLFAVHLILLFKMQEEHSVAIYLVINLWFIALFGRVLLFSSFRATKFMQVKVFFPPCSVQLLQSVVTQPETHTAHCRAVTRHSQNKERTLSSKRRTQHRSSLLRHQSVTYNTAGHHVLRPNWLIRLPCGTKGLRWDLVSSLLNILLFLILINMKTNGHAEVHRWNSGTRHFNHVCLHPDSPSA